MVGLDPTICRSKTTSQVLAETDPRVEPEEDGRDGSQVRVHADQYYTSSTRSTPGSVINACASRGVTL